MGTGVDENTTFYHFPHRASLLLNITEYFIKNTQQTCMIQSRV